LTPVEARNSKSSRSDRERKLHCSGVKLRQREVSVMTDAGDVSSKQFNFGSAGGTGIDLIVLVERGIAGHIEPVTLRIIGPLVTDFTFREADPDEIGNRIIRQGDSAQGK
jgi:hypothetical protein